MALDKKSVTTAFIGLGTLYLVGAGGFSLLGALATTGLVGAIGYGLYEALKDGRWQIDSGATYHHNAFGHPSVVVVEEHHHHRPRPHPGFWGNLFNFGGPMHRRNNNVHQTGSTFVPASQPASNVHQTGSWFLPSFSSYGQSNTSVRQTGSTFVPAPTSGTSISQTGSVFRPA